MHMALDSIHLPKLLRNLLLEDFVVKEEKSKILQLLLERGEGWPDPAVS